MRTSIVVVEPGQSDDEGPGGEQTLLCVTKPHGPGRVRQRGSLHATSPVFFGVHRGAGGDEQAPVSQPETCGARRLGSVVVLGRWRHREQDVRHRRRIGVAAKTRDHPVFAEAGVELIRTRLGEDACLRVMREPQASDTASEGARADDEQIVGATFLPSAGSTYCRLASGGHVSSIIGPDGREFPDGLQSAGGLLVDVPAQPPSCGFFFGGGRYENHHRLSGQKPGDHTGHDHGNAAVSDVAGCAHAGSTRGHSGRHVHGRLRELRGRGRPRSHHRSHTPRGRRI